MGVTMQQLREALDAAVQFGGIDPNVAQIRLVSDPDGKMMEPGTCGIGVTLPGEHGLLTAGIIGNLDAPREI